MTMSKKNTFKSVDTYSGGILANYQQKMKQQQRLLTIIKDSLSKPLSDHVLYCTLLAKKLFIYTDSAVWSSQLRFYQQSLLKAVTINPDLAYIKSVQIKIIISNGLQKKDPVLTIPSKNNIKLLYHCGESMKDEKLKQALLNLSQTLNKLFLL